MPKFTIKKRFSAGPLIKDISEIYEPDEEERVVPVNGAKVVVADYRLLIHDFKDVFEHPSFRERYGDSFCTNCANNPKIAYCNQAIDAWLIRNSAYMSEQQTHPNEVNSEINCGEPIKKGYRPPRYGRALVIPIEEHVSEQHARYLDVKGCGVGDGKVPTNDRHANGLDYVGVALGDFFYAWLVDRVLEITVPSYSVVPVYAVIDLGFDLKNYVYGTSPAGLHIRRAHHRNQGEALHKNESDAEKIALHIEMVLRAFGLTSTSPSLSIRSIEQEGKEYLQRSSGFIFNTIPPQDEDRYEELLNIVRGRRMDINNIQFANGVDWEKKSAQIVDFGLFRGCRNFDMPISTTAMNAPFFVGRTIMPEDPDYILPNKDLEVDPSIASRAVVNGVSFYAAETFRTGLTTRKEIEAMLRIGMARAWSKRIL